MVIKEWRCLAHGDFESAEPLCPRGCTTVERAFRTPVGLTSDKTKFSDATLRNVAADFGLTNMRGRPGEPARLPDTKTPVDLRPRFEPMAAKNGVDAALSAIGAKPENNMSNLPEFKRQVIGKRDPDRESALKVRQA